MVALWSPDPSNDEDQEVKPVPSLQLPMTGETSSDSEDENELFNNGYEPIPMNADDETILNHNIEEHAEVLSDNISDLPASTSIEIEIVREVWSAPPSENRIHMDADKENQVRNAMANFTLPSSSFPDWASNVPEEDWKQQLVERIKNMKQT